MAKELSIAIDIPDRRLAKSIEDHLKSLADTLLSRLPDPTEGSGHGHVKGHPDIIILGESPETGDLFTRLHHLKSEYPAAAVFLMSTDQSPEHIVEAMKAGVSEFLVAPSNPAKLTAAVEEVRAKLANAGKIAKGNAFSFISAKGGLGATVIAVNSATAMTMRKDNSVAFCDMSTQSGDASVLLDIVPQTTIIDICLNFHRLDIAFLRGAMTKNKTGLDFLAAPLNPEECENISPEHVARIMELAKKLYDNVIVDCTSMFIDDSTVEALKLSKKVFVVSDLSVPAVRNTARLIQLMKKVGIDPGNIEIVINRYIKGGALSIEEVESTLEKHIFWLFPNDFTDVVSSINRGIPLIKYHPTAPFSKNVVDFVDKILTPGASGDYRGIRGTFGRAI
ncbi:hypothetical protein [uncultured Desulfuromonas sp.]|uniref:hypothetical protein n=1 Tax=uncultured Desulfuromonas sp. TaxID=181013 RepID=UPI00260F5CC4|nr:hypothetical protein [uncultured Desulfuromonas sp.]